MPPGAIWLLPVTLGGDNIDTVIPAQVVQRIRQLRYFLVEEPKSARAFLKLVGHPGPLADLRIERLTNDTPHAELVAMIARVSKGMDAGVLSEAGCSAVADPGASLVRLAHQSGLRIAPAVGPSSLILALMGSGLETQRFSFHGYLPIKENDRNRAIRTLEQRSLAARETELFIETPYRNHALLDALLKVCRPETLLCIACDLTLPSEQITTSSIQSWRRKTVTLDKRHCVFLLLSQPESAGKQNPG